MTNESLVGQDGILMTYLDPKGEEIMIDLEATRVVVNPEEILIGGEVSATAQLSLVDTEGNGVSGIDLKIVSATGDEIIGVVGEIEDVSDGNYKAVITSMTAGTDKLKFVNEELNLDIPFEVSYVEPDVPEEPTWEDDLEMGLFDKNSSTITIDKDTLNVTNEDVGKITVKLMSRTEPNKPLKGYVGLDIVNVDGSGSIANIRFVDEVSDGVYEFEIIPSEEGIEELTFKTTELGGDIITVNYEIEEEDPKPTEPGDEDDTEQPEHPLEDLDIELDCEPLVPPKEFPSLDSEQSVAYIAESRLCRHNKFPVDMIVEQGATDEVTEEDGPTEENVGE